MARHKFDPPKHLCVTDVTFSGVGTTIKLNWAKNLPRRDQTHAVRVSLLKARIHVCPTRALTRAIQETPGGVSVPLINIEGVPLTEKDKRLRLVMIMRLMGIGKVGFTLHGFRRTGATLALGQEVPLDIIKAHGAWSLEL